MTIQNKLLLFDQQLENQEWLRYMMKLTLQYQSIRNFLNSQLFWEIIKNYLEVDVSYLYRNFAAAQ